MEMKYLFEVKVCLMKMKDIQIGFINMQDNFYGVLNMW